MVHIPAHILVSDDDKFTYMDVDSLTSPPLAPQSLIYISQAIAHVGSTSIPEWNDAEKMAHWRHDFSLSPECALVIQAAKAICQAVIDFKVAAYMRNIRGGLFKDVGIEFWLDDSFPETLARASTNSERDGVLIFLDRAQFFQAFPVHSHETNGAPNLVIDGFSPYIQLAMDVASHCRISADNSLTVDALQATVEERAKLHGLIVGSDGDLSKTLARAIAKLIRWPEARKGRGKAG